MAILSELSKKYAQAFINVFLTRVSKDDLLNFENFYNDIKKSKIVLFYIQTLSYIDKDSYNKVYSIFLKFISKYNLDSSFYILISLLIDSKRLSILPDVLYYLIYYCKFKLNLEYFTLVSAYPLNIKQVNAIKRFIIKNINKDIEIEEKVDNSLIAGFKIYSDNFLWQYCISDQIKRLKTN